MSETHTNTALTQVRLHHCPVLCALSCGSAPNSQGTCDADAVQEQDSRNAGQHDRCCVIWGPRRGVQAAPGKLHTGKLDHTRLQLWCRCHVGCTCHKWCQSFQQAIVHWQEPSNGNSCVMMYNSQHHPDGVSSVCVCAWWWWWWRFVCVYTGGCGLCVCVYGGVAAATHNSPLWGRPP